MQRCSHSTQALSLGEFASHRVASGGLVIFCKPHFKQAFQESGGKYSSLASDVPPASPGPRTASPGASYRPSGLALFDDDHVPVPPKREPPKKDKSAFESGFPVEFVLGGTPSKMAGNKCAACNAKVFPFCKLEKDGQLWHADCFKCTVCQAQLTAANSGKDGEGKPACLKHAAR